MEVLYKGRFLQVVRRGKWESVERVGVSGAVLILALTPDRKIILVEQYRIPVQSKVIEMPAGICDVEGEEPATTVRRELEEETGYQAEEVNYLCGGPNSPGLTNECAWMYSAIGLKKVGAGGGDADENITVHEIPLQDIKGWLEKKEIEGVLIDPKIFAALYFAERIDT